MYPSQLHTICTIRLNGGNRDFETSTVPGLVGLFALIDQNNPSCNQTKEAIVYNG